MNGSAWHTARSLLRNECGRLCELWNSLAILRKVVDVWIYMVHGFTSWTDLHGLIDYVTLDFRSRISVKTRIWISEIRIIRMAMLWLPDLEYLCQLFEVDGTFWFYTYVYCHFDENEGSQSVKFLYSLHWFTENCVLWLSFIVIEGKSLPLINLAFRLVKRKWS